jgi:hypothetical protein
MSNQGLGRHSRKMCAESSAKNTLTSQQFINPINPIGQNIWVCWKEALSERP